MDNKIKALSLFLSVILVLSFFTACRSERSPIHEETGHSSSEATQQTDSETEGKTEAESLPQNQDPPSLEEDCYAAMKKKLFDWFFEGINMGTLFSVRVGEDSFSELFSDMEKMVQTTADASGNTVITATYCYESLRFTLEGILYGDLPALDYVVWVENLGDETSKKISEFYALDAEFSLAGEGDYLLQTANGSTASPADFKPVEKKLSSLWSVFAPPGTGRSSDGAWPYFDVLGEGDGIFLAVGWSGQWMAAFREQSTGEINMRVSQQNLSTVLLQDEKIRSPRVVLTYFEGDESQGRNIWRSTVLSHYLPDPAEGDEIFRAPIALNFWGGRTEAYITDAIKRYANAGIHADMVWLDAGWNGNAPDQGYHTYVTNWHSSLGWWKINSNLFQSGSLKSLSDAAHQNGYRLMLWHMIEDGRSEVSHQLTFGRDSYYSYAHQEGDYQCLLLRLDDDSVLQTVLQYFRNLIEKQGVDCVRLDSWSRPMVFWLESDKILAEGLHGSGATPRNGITENRYMQNFYLLWDTLYEEYPNFFLDNTASGGRRMDIEMVMRGVTMWRSDSSHGADLEETQVQMQWLSAWLPFHSVGAIFPSDTYEYRSFYAGSACLYTDAFNQDALDGIKTVFDEFDLLRTYWYGSYYQLLQPTYDTASWQAYELFCEDKQEGMAVVIRREHSVQESMTLMLQGLDPSRTYVISNLDSGEERIADGKSLMEEGLNITIEPRQISTFLIRIKG